MDPKIFYALLFCISFYGNCARCQQVMFDLSHHELQVTVERTAQNHMELKVLRDGSEKISGQLGVGLDLDNGERCPGVDNCMLFPGGIRLHVDSHVPDAFQVRWETENVDTVLKDCYWLNATDGTHWYGGPEHWLQDWPLEKIVLQDYGYVTKEKDFGAIAEPYWLNSNGAYVYVDRRCPLFVDQNSERQDMVCFAAKNQDPYKDRWRILLQYTVAVKEDAREAHLHAVHHFLGKPTGHPNVKMIERPIFSTWAKYKRDVNDEVVRQFAQDMLDNGYRDSQFELDDDWEDCYGALNFRSSKFADINATVRWLHDNDFRVTLWVHPFVNADCQPWTDVGNANGYFVRNVDGDVLTQWWNSGEKEAQYLDFTSDEVRHWFVDRLERLRRMHGIDSFKFDAGESSWAPQVPVLEGDVELQPGKLTEDYVRTCALFGDLVEVRTGWGTQDLDVYVRMIDKDTKWGNDNGLYTLVTTLLSMNMNGYTMVLPDMIGGNGYNDTTPSAELFVRWLQANTFMPSIQFSFVPWEYNDTDIDVPAISHKFVDLHQEITPAILEAMDDSIRHGHPVNGPVWWLDPTDPTALGIDDEYLLGTRYLVAPVIVEGATARNVYLPKGTWKAHDGEIFETETGTWLTDYPAPVDVLPYFENLS